MKSEISSTTLGLAICIEDSIQQRFRRVFESRDAILSAISHPKFKLKWVEGQVKKDQYKQMFINEMRKYDDEMSIVENRNPEPDVATQKKDFYEFESDEGESSRDSVEVEAAEYLSMAKKIECLHKFPTVKRIFLKYNTTIPQAHTCNTSKQLFLFSLPTPPSASQSCPLVFSSANLVHIQCDFCIGNNHCEIIMGYNKCLLHYVHTSTLARFSTVRYKNELHSHCAILLEK